MIKNQTCYHCMRAAFVLALLLLPTIMFAQSLRVIYPNGGESFHADSTFTVRWASSGISDELEIEYTTDGVVWSPITVAPAASGSYMWRVPRFASTAIVGTIIRVSDPASSTRIDRSDAPFTLLPRVAVSSVDDVAAERSGVASRVYPNPAADRAEIEWRQNGRAEVTILLHASDGSIARSVDAGAREPGMNALLIDLGNLPTGTYMYEIRADRVLRGMVIAVR